jgi:hypothetical protein
VNKIYLVALPTGNSSYGYINDAEITGDVIGMAISEDGKQIASHYCSGVNWAKHDMGLTSDWKHEIYDDLYPNGYELEWIDIENIKTHPVLSLVFEKVE